MDTLINCTWCLAVSRRRTYITRDRRIVYLTIAFGGTLYYHWNFHSTRHWYRYPRNREWSLASFVVLFRRKSFQISIADETKVQHSWTTQIWIFKSDFKPSQTGPDSERKEVYSYDCNHDDRTNKLCITCLDGHCDVLSDENILSYQSRWM